MSSQAGGWVAEQDGLGMVKQMVVWLNRGMNGYSQSYGLPSRWISGYAEGWVADQRFQWPSRWLGG